VKPADRSCTIIVRARRLDDDLVLTVEDDGVGMVGTEIERLNRALGDATEIQGAHIGLRNVNQRTRLLFGDGYGVTLHPNDADPLTSGLRVVVRLPAIVERGKNPTSVTQE
jgi:sensor histidine kinase YesM